MLTLSKHGDNPLHCILQAALFYPTFLLHVLICALRPLFFLLRVRSLASTTAPLVDDEEAPVTSKAAATVVEEGCGGFRVAGEGVGSNVALSASIGLTGDHFFFAHNMLPPHTSLTDGAERVEGGKLPEADYSSIVVHGSGGGGAAVRVGDEEAAVLLEHAAA